MSGAGYKPRPIPDREKYEAEFERLFAKKHKNQLKQTYVYDARLGRMRIV